MIFLRLTLLSAALLIVTGCTPKIEDVKTAKKASITKYPKTKTPLLEYLNKTDKKLGKHSAFYPLPLPVDAFAARLFLIDKATTSLDVQYYIYENDLIGKIISAHLLMAAQRGVRVRILLDDLSTAGKDKNLQKLAGHPNIELRLFNPNRLRSSFRNLALLFNVNSLGKRMHNKSLIADGSAAIIGGRNIGNIYFAANMNETLFLDYDVLSIGAVVPKISKAFDIYWNSEQAIPAREVLEGHADTGTEKSFENTMQLELQKFCKSRYGQAIEKSDFSRKIRNDTLTLTVSKRTDFYYDDPSKVAKDENDDVMHISKQISEDLKKADNKLLIISPYFIPSEPLLKRMQDLRNKGVEITVITNSLASTDVSPVYAGYQGYIKELVQMGVNLYELKPHSFNTELKKKIKEKPPRLSLHTKMMIFDNDRLAIGSANMDPRSDKLNTELFLVISSKKLTQQQQNTLNKILNLNNFYKLSWGKYPKVFEEDSEESGPVWTTFENGKKKVYYERPEVGFWKAFSTDLISLFPIHGYL